MTRKEVIKYLKDTITLMSLLREEYEMIDKQHLKGILKALEQEPCDDCISREEAIYAINGFSASETVLNIKELPSVKPTRIPDMVAMLTDLSREIGEIEDGYTEFNEEEQRSLTMISLESVDRLIQQKINSLKAEIEPQ